MQVQSTDWDKYKHGTSDSATPNLIFCNCKFITHSNIHKPASTRAFIRPENAQSTAINYRLLVCIFNSSSSSSSLLFFYSLPLIYLICCLSFKNANNSRYSLEMLVLRKKEEKQARVQIVNLKREKCRMWWWLTGMCMRVCLSFIINYFNYSIDVTAIESNWNRSEGI